MSPGQQADAGAEEAAQRVEVEGHGATPRRQIPQRLSPAALNRYRACPRQFLWFDVERRHPKEEPSPVFAQANAVHHALERFFGIRPEQRSLEVLEQALRHVWPEHRKRAGFASRDEEIHFGLEALELLRRFHAAFDTEIVPLARESWLSLRLPNGQTVYGKADRIDPLSSESIAVIDYKTGRRGDLDAGDLARDPAAQVYALAAQRRTGRRVEAVRLLFLRDGEEVRWEPEVEDLDEAAARLTKLVEVIRADEEFPATPGPQCRFCSFELLCPDRSRVDVTELTVAGEVPF
jgi:RecB family exonuclease